MFSILFWGAMLRMAQALVQAAPTILVGVLVAAIFDRCLGAEGTRRVFGGRGWKSFLCAWAWGMMLPVCSLGVIPIERQMRRAGLSGGTILAFGLTAPLFNPLSVLYGLTLSSPVVIITFSFCSLVIVTLSGLAWDRLFPGTEMEPSIPPPAPYGSKRLLATAVFGARELIGSSAIYMLIGLAGVGLLSAVLPFGCLQTAAEHDNPWAPLVKAGVAIPAYSTPMTAIVQVASMFAHGNSPGAAFALLALGAGANLGLLAWMARSYGWRRAGAWFAILIGIVLALCYGVDRPLYPTGVEPAGHTHAFDVYCCPFRTESDPVWRAAEILRPKTAPYELVRLGALALALVAGAVLQVGDRGQRIERWLAAAARKPLRYDVVIPGPVLGVIALAGLVALSVGGCYVYYPHPHEIFDEMRSIDTEVAVAAKRGDWKVAEHWIPTYDDWTRKLQVSVFLRSGRVEEYHAMKARILRDRLELLKHEVEDQDWEAAAQLGTAVHTAYMRLHAAYVASGMVNP